MSSPSQNQVHCLTAAACVIARALHASASLLQDPQYAKLANLLSIAADSLTEAAKLIRARHTTPSKEINS